MTEAPKNIKEIFSKEAKTFRITLFNSPEGRLFVSGVCAGLMFLGWLVSNYIWLPDMAHAIIGMTATYMVFGRAAGMSLGYASGLGHFTVIAVNMIMETVITFTFYPLFVFTWRHFLEVPRLESVLARIREAAEANKHWVHRYGIPGLFIFVLFPFWMTGPLVGAVIGFMLGLKLWVNMTVVMGAAYLAITGWAFGVREFHDQLLALTPYASLLLLAAFIAIAVAGFLLHFIQRKKQIRQK
jgi:uncharacterized membrane protein